MKRADKIENYERDRASEKLAIGTITNRLKKKGVRICESIIAAHP